MHDIENPYAAPTSKSRDSASSINGEVRKLFSPTQGALGAFLLGPITGLYAVQANFAAMGESAKRANTFVYGSILILAVALVSPLLPEKIPAFAFGLLYMLPTRMFMDKFQLSKQQIIDSLEYKFQSNWLVFGAGVLGIIIYLILIIAVYLGYAALGWLPPLW